MAIKHLRASTLLKMGVSYTGLGKYQTAIDYCLQSLAIAESISDQQLQGDILSNLAAIYVSKGNNQESINYSKRALEFFSNDSEARIRINNNLGSAYSNLRQYEQSLVYFKQALSQSKILEYKKFEATSLANMGYVYSALGKFDCAIDNYKECKEITKSIGDTYGECVVLLNLGTINAKKHEYKIAKQYLESSLEIAKEKGYKHEEAVIQSNLNYLQDRIKDDLNWNKFNNQLFGIPQKVRDYLVSIPLIKKIIPYQNLLLFVLFVILLLQLKGSILSILYVYTLSLLILICATISLILISRFLYKKNQKMLAFSVPSLFILIAFFDFALFFQIAFVLAISFLISIIFIVNKKIYQRLSETILNFRKFSELEVTTSVMPFSNWFKAIIQFAKSSWLNGIICIVGFIVPITVLLAIIELKFPYGGIILIINFVVIFILAKNNSG
jgi:tetratricopeptide (TPR) repeat protein